MVRPVFFFGRTCKKSCATKKYQVISVKNIYTCPTDRELDHLHMVDPVIAVMIGCAGSVYTRYKLCKTEIYSTYSCEIEEFVDTHLCKLCVMLRSRMLLGACPH